MAVSFLLCLTFQPVWKLHHLRMLLVLELLKTFFHQVNRKNCVELIRCLAHTFSFLLDLLWCWFGYFWFSLLSLFQRNQLLSFIDILRSLSDLLVRKIKSIFLIFRPQNLTFLDNFLLIFLLL